MVSYFNQSSENRSVDINSMIITLSLSKFYAFGN